MSTTFATTKLFTIAFFGYLITSIILAAILMSVWLSGQNTQEMTPVQLQNLAESSLIIQFWSAVIGTVTALVISMILAHKTRHENNSAIIGFSVLLTCFSLLSIWLHPEHHIIYQAIKPLSPFLVCFFGYWLMTKRTSNTQFA
jgi:hypothetical protein